MQERWAEIQAIWKSNQVLYVITGFLAGILFFPAIEALSTNASELFSGFVPEAVGIAFTVLLIDRLYQRREQEREDRALKAKLIREAGSDVNDVAKHAINQLRERGWLSGENGLLRNCNLFRANLSGAHMREANLANAMLSNALLVKTYLWYANMELANLWGTVLTSAILERAELRRALLLHANFESANLWEANLEHAQAYHANFSKADLRGANLRGANLLHANLSNAFLLGTQFDQNTILPNGTNWTPETDMKHFIDPTHSEFWEPEWVKQEKEPRPD